MISILKRPEGELIKRVYKSQREEKHPGDWCELVAQDMEMIKLNLSDDAIANMNVCQYKELVKRLVRKAAFDELETKKESHEKVKENKYTNLKSS